MRRSWLDDVFSFLACGGLLLAVSINLVAQTTQPPAPTTTTPGTGTPGAGTVTRPPTTTIPTTPSTNPTNPNQQQQFPEMQRPIFMSGRVMMDDGQPPQESVLIERVCNGNPRPEGYTDSKGRFSFQLGQNNNILADASVASSSDSGFGGDGFGGQQRSSSLNSMGGMSSGISERQLNGCELRASLAGFRSESVSLAGRRMMDNPDVGTILMHRMVGVEGYTSSITSMLAPKDAKKAWEKGRDLARRKKIPEAQKEFQKAVDSYPKYALAWYDLGMSQEAQHNVTGARESYGKSIAADPKFIKPYVKIFNFDAKDRKWEEVAATTGKVIKLNPFDFPEAYFYNAVANLNLKKLDEAETSARAAMKMDKAKRIPQLDHMLGIILAQKQDYPGAAVSLRSFLSRAPNDPSAALVKTQLAEIDQFLTAKTEQAKEEPEQKEDPPKNP
jgi:tetratricopeptide (TPR) repeat protein